MPTSVYLGWISVATVADVTATLVKAGVPSYGPSSVDWTVAILVIVGLLAALMLITKRDLYYVLVVVWALFGIALKQFTNSATVSTTAIVVLAVVVVLWIVVLARNIVPKK